jgi:3-hydroxyacyl-[acyl-carrier-protein] dehydratase
MKFQLVDKIELLEPSKRIVTIKALSLAEEYLADHFPAFPVLPGVLMLEALVQSAAWLVRLHQGFSRSIVVLQSARNVRYASFVQPGDTLRCDVEAVELGEERATFKGSGSVGERLTVSAKLELRMYNLAQKQPYLAAADASIISQLRGRLKLIAPAGITG